jgi:hypothetical protein
MRKERRAANDENEGRGEFQTLDFVVGVSSDGNAWGQAAKLVNRKHNVLTMYVAGR